MRLKTVTRVPAASYYNLLRDLFREGKMKILNKGFSLVQVVLAMGMLSALSLGVMKMGENMSSMSKQGSGALEILELKQHIRYVLSSTANCTETFRDLNAKDSSDETNVTAIQVKLRDGSWREKFVIGDRYGQHIIPQSYLLKENLPDTDVELEGTTNLMMSFQVGREVRHAKLTLEVAVDTADKITSCRAINNETVIEEEPVAFKMVKTDGQTILTYVNGFQRVEWNSSLFDKHNAGPGYGVDTSNSNHLYRVPEDGIYSLSTYAQIQNLHDSISFTLWILVDRASGVNNEILGHGIRTQETGGDVNARSDPGVLLNQVVQLYKGDKVYVEIIHGSNGPTYDIPPAESSTTRGTYGTDWNGEQAYYFSGYKLR